MALRSKIKYLLTSIQKQIVGRCLQCPSCGSTQSTVITRKYVVTELRRCSGCQLLYRTPTTTEEENRAFYQMEYRQGFTTDMPSPQELNELKARGFKDTQKDYSKYIDVLASLGCRPGDRVLDYGCSWGYGSWQLAQAGYMVTGYEISRPRCEYARTQMRVNATFSLDKIKAPFDVFFSSHVLEHVPSVGQCIELARRLVKPGGWFLTFTPNGSQAFKTKNHSSYMKLWGLVHPNFLDDRFYKSVFRRESFVLDSSPYDLASIAKWAASLRDDSSVVQRVLKLAGSELLVVARISTY